MYFTRAIAYSFFRFLLIIYVFLHLFLYFFRICITNNNERMMLLEQATFLNYDTISKGFKK